jgi:predicted N-acyltransferase
MAEAKRFDSIAAIDRAAWNACFPGELEDYDYFVAIERANIEGFTQHYYAVMEGETLLAAIPAFFTRYDLATTAEGGMRQVFSAIKRLCPALVTLRLACLGSAETETCPIGMHPSCDEAARIDLFTRLVEFFTQDAYSKGTGLLAFKDMTARDKARYDPVLQAQGFCCVAGQPTALLPIDFASVDAYLARLSAATRKDMRRKLRRHDAIRIEYRRQIDDVLDAVYAMYLETKGRSDWQFEELTPDYFREVMAQMGERAVCAVYFLGDTPIAANLMLVDGTRLLDKFFCMRGNEGRAHNMYFVSWFANVQFCLDRGLTLYQSGQAGYDTKLRLGSQLRGNWMAFRHRNILLHRLLRLISPLLAFSMPEKETP